MSEPGGRGVTELRHTVFVSVTVAFIVFLYLFSPFSSLFLGWFVDFEDNISHRVHEVTFGILFAMMMVGVAAQLRRPELKIAAMQQAILVAVVLSIVVAVSTGWEWTALFYMVPPLVIADLHPARRQIFSLPQPPRGGLLYLLVPATLPFLLGFADEFEKAANEVRGHQAHWGGMAAFALIVVLLALLAASRPTGWRLVAWTTGSSMIVYGVASMSFPFDASARPDLAAVIAIVWAVAFLITTERIVRLERRRVEAVTGETLERPATTEHPLVLRRARTGRLLGGVARGLARRFGLPVAAVRVLFVFPLVGAVVYLVAWLLIPLEQPGDVVGPPPRRRWHRLRSAIVVVPALAITLFGGFVIYDVARDAPPVPHDITSVSPRTCMECHATGLEHAPVIEPLTHNFYSDIASSRIHLPFCGECHRLPKTTQAFSPEASEDGALVGLRPDAHSGWRLGPADLKRVERALAEIDAEIEFQ